MCELARCRVESAGVLHVELARSWMEKMAGMGLFAIPSHVGFADVNIAFALFAFAFSFSFSFSFSLA